MKTVTSRDGTRIALEQAGEGEPLLLVDGAFCRRDFGPMRALAKRLAPYFRVTLCDRRGRGDSGDAPEYAVEREIEDIAALVESLGGEASVFGTSSGAVLAARAAGGGVNVKRLAIYEPPLALDGTHYPKPPDFTERIGAMIEAGRRGEAVKLFLRVVGAPRFAILMMQATPVFGGLKRTAHTLPYDFAILGDTQRGGPLPEELERTLRSIEAPTLSLAGGKSPPWLKHASERVAEAIPDCRTGVVPGQGHNASAAALAPVLIRFFAEAPEPSLPESHEPGGSSAAELDAELKGAER